MPMQYRFQTEHESAGARNAVKPTREGNAPGLCGNCTDRDTCAILPKAQAPILVCELHACETGGPSLRDEKIENAPTAISGHPELLGLCANCDHSSDCTLPRPESGVWHCEEYV